MAFELLNLEAGGMDGEKKLAPGSADYVAGQPCKITSTGLDLATNPFDVIGLMKNDKSVDASSKVGPMAGDTPDQSDLRATRCYGTLSVKMTRGKLLDGTLRTPFLMPPTGNGAWAVNNKLYVNADGVWDNVPVNEGEQSFGTVTKAPASATDSLEAAMTLQSAQSADLS